MALFHGAAAVAATFSATRHGYVPDWSTLHSCWSRATGTFRAGLMCGDQASRSATIARTDQGIARWGEVWPARLARLLPGARPR